jgi:type I restriction enzyme M protein
MLALNLPRSGLVQHRTEEPRYSRRVAMDDISKNNFNLNISRYISTAVAEEEINLQAVHAELTALTQRIDEARDKHNAFLNELGLAPLP